MATADHSCWICSQAYTNPRRLRCHTFCLRCIEGLVSVDFSTIQCPRCQRQYELPTGGLQALPADDSASAGSRHLSAGPLPYERRNERPTITIHTFTDDRWAEESPLPARDVEISNATEIYTTYDSHCHVYSTDGTHIRQFRLQGFDPCPHITVATDGCVLVTDWTVSCVHVYSGQGQLVRSFGGRGDGALSSPNGIVTNENNVYVACNHRVHVFTMQGAFVRFIGEGLLTKPIYLAFNRRQELIVSVNLKNAIFFFDRHGSLLREFRGDGEREIRRPLGICVDACGNLLVANNNGERLDVFTDQLTYRCSVTADVEVKGICGMAVTTGGVIVAADVDREELMII